MEIRAYSGLNLTAPRMCPKTHIVAFTPAVKVSIFYAEIPFSFGTVYITYKVALGNIKKTIWFVTPRNERIVSVLHGKVVI